MPTKPSATTRMPRSSIRPDVAVCDALVDRARPGMQPCRHREPDAPPRVREDEVGLAERLAVEVGVERRRHTGPGHPLDRVGAEVRDQEVAVRSEGEPVRQRAVHRVALDGARVGETGVDALRDQLLRAVGIDAHHAAASVGRPERAVGLGEDALGTLQIVADEGDRLTLDVPAGQRVLRHRGPHTRSATSATRRSFASCVSGVMRRSVAVSLADANPHCVDTASLSFEWKRAASSMRAQS